MCGFYLVPNQPPLPRVDRCRCRHHAKRGEAAGFCYVNDGVLAVLHLTKAFETVLTIDIGMIRETLAQGRSEWFIPIYVETEVYGYQHHIVLFSATFFFLSIFFSLVCLVSLFFFFFAFFFHAHLSTCIPSLLNRQNGSPYIIVMPHNNTGRVPVSVLSWASLLR